MMTSGYQQYQEMQAKTAGPGDLVVMLYEGAIRFLNRSKAELASNNFEGVHNSLIRAQNIILELKSTLKKDVSPVGGHLDQVYDYMYHRLVEANMRKDPEIVDEVIGLLRVLLPAWKEAVRVYQREIAGQPQVKQAVALALEA